MEKFEVLNVKCSGCANTLKTKLKNEGFGEVEVNLELFPRVITVYQDNTDIKRLRQLLKHIGYPMADEQLGRYENIETKAKSFISCAVGKIG